MAVLGSPSGDSVRAAIAIETVAGRVMRDHGAILFIRQIIDPRTGRHRFGDDEFSVVFTEIAVFF